ncbi:hypothetical protein CPB84DRAFT_1686772, partial [Gymnopilus junonius]
PQASRFITHSQLHPHVAAADHLFSWDTPFGVRHREDLAKSLPPSLINSALMSIRGALAPNTKNTYATGPLHFMQFCDTWDISEEAQMPASYALLCAFIGMHKGMQSGNMIHSWISGLWSWHIVNHAPWYSNDDWVHLARISANKEGTKHKCPLCAPVSVEHLTALHCAISIHDPFHAAMWAIAVCTFFGCCHLGEMMVNTAAAFDEKYHVLHSTIVHFCQLHDSTYSVSSHIPWTKTTKELGASVILTACNNILCPFTALKNHLTVNVIVQLTHGVQIAGQILYTSPSGTHKNLLKHDFLNFVTGIWSSAMLAHILGHSFRIGGAVELLLVGIPPEIVAATGSWTSLAFLLYWHHMEEILPMSTSKAYNKTHFNNLATIFKQFHINHSIPLSLITASDGNLTL